ncbi:unnamed protein product, partial [Prorocentrum cordatum]
MATASSTDAPAAAAASAHEQLLALTCMKCQEATTMSTSYPSGARNPLRRVCNICSSTDRTAARRTAEYKKKKDAKKPLTDEDVDVKANINKMTPDEKVAFYRAEKERKLSLHSRLRISHRTQKAKQVAKDGSSNGKRSFAGVKGSVEHSKVQSLTRDELDLFETFEDFALGQIGLKRCEDEAGAKPLWLEALADPQKQKIKFRGQWLLGKFGGVAMHNTVSDELRNALKQAQMIDSKEGLDEFLTESTDLQARREKGIKKDYMVQPDKDQPEVNDYDVEGSVKVDEGMISDKAVMKTITAQIAKKAEDLAEQEKSIIEAAAAKSRPSEQPTPEPSPNKKPKTSVAVAKMGLESAIISQCATIESKVENLKAKFYQEASEELRGILDTEGKQELKDMTDAFEVKFGSYSAKAEDRKTEIRNVLANLDVSIGAEAIMSKKCEIIATAKMFCKSEGAEIKTLVTELTTMITDMKAYGKSAWKATENRDKEATKHLHSKNALVDSPGKFASPLTSAFWAHHQCEANQAASGIGIHWNIEQDFMKNGSAVLIPSERTTECVKTIVELAYYRSQKAWVKAAMAKTTHHTSAAYIVKDSAKKTVESSIASIVDASVRPRQTRDGCPWLNDLTAVSFWQHTKDLHSISNAPYCMPQVRFVLEGEVALAGLPVDAVVADTLVAKRTSLMNMSLTDFFNLVQTKGGIAVKLKPGSIVLPPGNFMIVEVALGGAEVHGLCWSLLGSKSLASVCLPILEQFLKENVSMKKSPYVELLNHLQEITEGAPE